MTIKDLKEKLPTLKGEERAMLEKLMPLLTGVSQSTMLEFQNNWDWRNNPPPDGYDKFVVAQNKVIMDCLRIEQSDVGILVRDTLGMPALTDDTEVV